MLRSSEKREPLVEKYPHQLSLWASIGVLFLIDSVVGKFKEFAEKPTKVNISVLLIDEADLDTAA